MSQSSAVPSTPCWRSLWRRMVWFTVSKAALRSSNSRMLRAPESALNEIIVETVLTVSMVTATVMRWFLANKS